jgi:hypothetical protein
MSIHSCSSLRCPKQNKYLDLSQASGTMNTKLFSTREISQHSFYLCFVIFKVYLYYRNIFFRFNGPVTYFRYNIT